MNNSNRSVANRRLIFWLTVNLLFLFGSSHPFGNAGVSLGAARGSREASRVSVNPADMDFAMTRQVWNLWRTPLVVPGLDVKYFEMKKLADFQKGGMLLSGTSSKKENVIFHQLSSQADFDPVIYKKAMETDSLPDSLAPIIAVDGKRKIIIQKFSGGLTLDSFLKEKWTDVSASEDLLIKLRDRFIRLRSDSHSLGLDFDHRQELKNVLVDPTNLKMTLTDFSLVKPGPAEALSAEAELRSLAAFDTFYHALARAKKQPPKTLPDFDFIIHVNGLPLKVFSLLGSGMQGDTFKAKILWDQVPKGVAVQNVEKGDSGFVVVKLYKPYVKSDTLITAQETFDNEHLFLNHMQTLVVADTKSKITVQKFIEGTPLSTVLQRLLDTRDFNKIDQMAQKYIELVNSFHEKYGFAHMDLQPANVILQNGGNLVPIDVGMSKKFIGPPQMILQLKKQDVSIAYYQFDFFLKDQAFYKALEDHNFPDRIKVLNDAYTFVKRLSPKHIAKAYRIAAKIHGIELKEQTPDSNSKQNPSKE